MSEVSAEFERRFPTLKAKKKVVKEITDRFIISFAQELAVSGRDSDFYVEMEDDMARFLGFSNGTDGEFEIPENLKDMAIKEAITITKMIMARYGYNLKASYFEKQAK